MVFILLFKSFLPRPGGNFYVNIHIYHLPEEPPPPDIPPPKPQNPPPPPKPPPPNHQGYRPVLPLSVYARETTKSNNRPAPINIIITGTAIKIEPIRKCQRTRPMPPPKIPPCHQDLDLASIAANICKIRI